MSGTLSPMMQQYLQMKENYKDSILFYRLGDFYEMFFDDAVLASKELELTLTGRDCGLDERAPMCGVPYHSVDSYIARLVAKGFKVTICEQKKDETNTVTGRDVIRTITPGTITDPENLDETKNRYIMSAYQNNGELSVCFADVSTGEVFFSENCGENNPKIKNELAKYMPSEIYSNEDAAKNSFIEEYRRENSGITISVGDNSGDFTEIVKKHLGDEFSRCPIRDSLQMTNFGFLLDYLFKTQLCDLRHLNKITVPEGHQYVDIDASTWRSLEITENMRTREKKGSLLGVLDITLTAMGARCLRKNLENPLGNAAEIIKRINAVKSVFIKTEGRAQLRELLKDIRDIERLITKIVYGTVNPRDLITLASSLEKAALIKKILPMFESSLIEEAKNAIYELEEIRSLISKSICDNPPLIIREGGFIREGFNAETDRLRTLQTNAKEIIIDLENREKERTGIKTLRVRYNKVFGYYIEITNSFLDQVPEDYIRKQTLVNAERFITPELKKIEDELLSANDKLISLENELYQQITDEIGKYIPEIKSTSSAIGIIDMISTFAEISARNGYVEPEIDLSDEIVIKNGRHPVVESLMKSELFVPNDTYLNTSTDKTAVITGPNMAGKSTYMRQVALIVLMAQIGCFVPAYSAKIGVVDKIFTRVGASDDLVSGQSTFMLEMNEVAYIVKNATKRSLLIFDEIGRGTSTFDGMSIAQSVLEFVTKKISARSLFATHYHELSALEATLPGIKNYNIAAKKRGKSIIFLRKIVPGGTDDSYGIDVARLAGVPEEIIKRAETILQDLESSKPSEKYVKQSQSDDEPIQLSFENPAKDEIIEKLQKTDVTVLTPVEALNELYTLSNKAKEIE